jgi:hypothetical protein
MTSTPFLTPARRSRAMDSLVAVAADARRAKSSGACRPRRPYTPGRESSPARACRGRDPERDVRAIRPEGSTRHRPETHPRAAQRRAARRSIARGGLIDARSSGASESRAISSEGDRARMIKSRNAPRSAPLRLGARADTRGRIRLFCRRHDARAFAFPPRDDRLERPRGSPVVRPRRRRRLGEIRIDERRGDPPAAGDPRCRDRDARQRPRETPQGADGDVRGCQDPR